MNDTMTLVPAHGMDYRSIAQLTQALMGTHAEVNKGDLHISANVPHDFLDVYTGQYTSLPELCKMGYEGWINVRYQNKTKVAAMRLRRGEMVQLNDKKLKMVVQEVAK